MNIGDVIKEQQPKEYKKLNEEKLTQKDIEELMDHDYYKRTKRGRIIQVHKKNTY